MKRWTFLLLLFLLLTAGFAAARAADMRDITALCRVTATNRQDPASALVDGKMATQFRFYRSTEITITPGAAVYGIYLKWDAPPDRWQVTVDVDGAREVLYTGGGGGFYHEYLPVDGLTEPFIIRTGTGTALPALSEMILLGEGDLPGWVQVWEPRPEKAELMVFSAHCDDELVFFGGVLPVYTGIENRDTVVVYMCASGATRRHEALDGLWACGVRQHPVFGPFRDFRTESLPDAYAKWGKEKARAFVMEMIRQYKPDVVATHDLKGEYGHGAHMLTAAVVLDCVEAGFDGAFQPLSYEAWGGWQPMKLYLHLYRENPLELDFDIPLKAFGERTAREVADDAFACHASQQDIRYRAGNRGLYDCAQWGLAFTRVGYDVAKDHMFEHVDQMVVGMGQPEIQCQEDVLVF